MGKIFRDKYFWIVLLTSFLSLFLFLGSSSFHTRGEPREALVAQAMINDSNWAWQSAASIPARSRADSRLVEQSVFLKEKASH